MWIKSWWRAGQLLISQFKLCVCSKIFKKTAAMKTHKKSVNIYLIQLTSIKHLADKQERIYIFFQLLPYSLTFVAKKDWKGWKPHVKVLVAILLDFFFKLNSVLLLCTGHKEKVLPSLSCFSAVRPAALAVSLREIWADSAWDCRWSREKVGQALPAAGGDVAPDAGRPFCPFLSLSISTGLVAVMLFYFQPPVSSFLSGGTSGLLYLY